MNSTQSAKRLGHVLRTGHELVEKIDGKFVYQVCCGKKFEIVVAKES